MVKVSHTAKPRVSGKAPTSYMAKVIDPDRDKELGPLCDLPHHHYGAIVLNALGLEGEKRRAKENEHCLSLPRTKKE